MNKLITIQTKLKAPKNQKNVFGGYNYRSCEDILEAVKPLLAETDTYLIISDDIVQIGTRYYVKATATLKEDDKILAQTTAYAREPETVKGQAEAQITGSSSSYARKYALNGLFDIDDTKDADSDEKRAQPAKSGAGAAKAAPEGGQATEPKKPAEAPKITFERACEMTFIKGDRKYKLGELSNEWLVKALKSGTYLALHPYIEVILDRRVLLAAEEDEEQDIPFNV